MIRRRRLMLPSVICAVVALGAAGALLRYRSWRHDQAARVVAEAEAALRADLDRQREARVREAARVHEAAVAEDARRHAALRAESLTGTCFRSELKVNPYFAEALNRAHQERYGHGSSRVGEGVAPRGKPPRPASQSDEHVRRSAWSRVRR